MTSDVSWQQDHTCYLQGSQFSATQLSLRDLRIHNQQIDSLQSGHRGQRTARNVSGTRPSPHPIFDISKCFSNAVHAFIASVCRSVLSCASSVESKGLAHAVLCPRALRIGAILHSHIHKPDILVPMLHSRLSRDPCRFGVVIQEHRQPVHFVGLLGETPRVLKNMS